MLIKIKALYLILLFSYNYLLSYNLFYGNLHSHTSYSDGQSVPSHAFVFARDTARIDVFAVTDHGELLTVSEWADIKRQAGSATIPNRFLGLAGFEWTNPILGHINIFNTDDYTNCLLNPTMVSIYNWMANRTNAIGQFNHPAVQNYNSFAFSPIGDVSMAFFELQNKDHAKRYYVALDSGWQVGIVANQDNHSANWGKGNRLTGIWSDSLTKSSIISAFQNMRTFGTLDRNFQFWFKANGSWMGSIIPNGEIQFEVFCLDPDSADFIYRVDIVTNNNTILDSIVLGNINHVEWQTTTFTNNYENRYFFVRVIENDSNYILSSPIWTEGGVAIDDQRNIESESYKISANPFTSSITINFNSNYLKDLDRIKIYSAAGKVIKNFLPKPVIRWDGKDNKGNEVPAGVYFVSFEKSGNRHSEKILRLGH